MMPDDPAPAPAPEPGEVTRLLHGVRSGDRAALDRVLAFIYDDLRSLARRQLHREHQARTLEPTALVHEAYLKMVSGASIEAKDRAHFLALAAHAMRQVLVDHARPPPHGREEGRRLESGDSHQRGLDLGRVPRGAGGAR